MENLKLLIEVELSQIFEEAKRDGQSYIDIVSGDLHKRLGFVNRYPACCNGMRSMMKKDDIILEAPPNGDGASVKIRYFLKRR
ncbi:hypothetical protein AB4Z30_14710 [Paenibacillus sp. 2TAF8]|uniref:hypothetical protein n=1 Tax=Paenibacillus sp. 2TAF8 TaxID=3233020 RepID=UPI003F95AAAE